jgi:hypothetical protein
MKTVLLYLVLCSSIAADAQLNESFSDGDFTAGPVWSGSTAWQVVTNSDVAAGSAGSNTLRLNVVSGGGTAYLSTRIAGSWGPQQTWAFWLGRRGQAATSSNASYVWLYASEVDVTGMTVDGYRIRFGDDAGTGDKIQLEAVTDGVGTVILASGGATTNAITDFGFLVRITRDATGLWTLFTSTLPLASGTGAVATDIPNAANTNVLQGSVSNTAISNFDNGYMAVAALHTTGTQARAGAEFDQIVFSSVSEGPLPVRFGSIEAVPTSSGVGIYWTNQTEADVLQYILERSLDGLNFMAFARLDPLKNDGGRADYQYFDRTLPDGIILYRVKAIEVSGRVVYSAIVKIALGKNTPSLNLYPNPVLGNQMGFQIGNLPRGAYIISISNAAAQEVFIMPINHTGGFLSRLISLNLGKGLYCFEIRGPVTLQKRFIIQ